ncbi:MAG: CRISPR-associated protein Cas4 [Planctomycetales bacterium]|nr:CRISPR-associated protein Cas4 [Planctomycetales bacterium]MCA9197156.1 CRISPR-associated protein Cas4 [Planctomycetales bacterium]
MIDSKPSITITHVLEHLYCPRFTYFEYVLTIPERQERRWKVERGRQVHLERSKMNKSYLRSKLNVVERQFDVPLASQSIGVRGVADEVLTFADGTMGPFDYKFAKAPKTPFRNQRMQCVLYGMLIAEWFGCEVNRCYLCYTRDNYHVVEVPITERARRDAMNVVQEVVEVIQHGYLPPPTTRSRRCIDCCYRNICVQ